MAVKNYHTISAGTVQRDVNNGSVNFGKWQAPPHGWFKVNWKASVDTKNGRVGLGAAVRDHLVTICVAQTMARPVSLDPTFAEAMAALMAAEICCDLGQLQIQLKGDAKVVVEVVNSKIFDDSCRGHLTEDIRTMLLHLSCWEIGYVRRVENKVAHVLARLALNNNLNRVWQYDPPECIREILDAEQFALYIPI
jgi:ribonuclease HI